MEECVLDMGQGTKDAASMDAQIKLRKEEYVVGMVHTATITKNLQLSRRVSDQNS